MNPVSFSNLPLIAALLFIFPSLFIAGLRSPGLAIGLLTAALPALNLARRLFAEDAMPYPSLETLAVILLWLSIRLGRLRTRRPVLSWSTGTKVAAFCFLLAGIISSLLSRDPGLSLRILFCGGVIPLLMFDAALHLQLCWQEIKPVLWGVFAMTMQTGIYTLFAYHQRQQVGPEKELLSWMYGSAPAAGLFVVPSVAATMVAPAIPLGIWYLLYRPTSPSRLPRQYSARLATTLGLITVLLAALLTGLLSLSRGSWAGLAFVLAGSALLLKRWGTVPLVVMGIALLVIAGRGLWETAESIFTFRLTSSGAARNIDIRSVNYELALMAAPHHILAGIGLGQYTELYHEFPNALASSLPRLWFAHSLFLTLIPEIGLLGTLAFAGFFIRGLVDGFAALRRRAVSCEIRSERTALSSVEPVPADWQRLAASILIGIVAYIIIASTTGAHLVSYLLCNPQYLYYDTQGTYFASPALILIFTLLGLLTVIRDPKPTDGWK